MWCNPINSRRWGALNHHWLFMAFFLVIVTTQAALAQYCDECSRPRVALYDSDVQVPRPAIADSIVKWFQLFWVAGWAHGSFLNDDPSKDCITWLDGAMVNSHEYQDNTLKFGTDYVNLPPPGPVKSATYLITSTVTGSNGNYIFTLNLETAESREIVATNSQPFTYGVSNGQAAGEAAASAFMPLFQTIRDFEINKRNSDITVAIRDLWTPGSTPEMTAIPRKTKLVLGDSTMVDITMIDCDGVPLANRTISFAAQTFQGMLLDGPSGGIVRPTTITTDADGKATVTFISTNSTGMGIINAWYVHKKPCGSDGVFNGQAMVNISPRIYEVSIFGGYSFDNTEENLSPLAPLEIWAHNLAGASVNFVYELRNVAANPDSFLAISYPPQAPDTIRGLITLLGAKFASLDDERVFLQDGTLDGVSHWESYANGNMTPSGTLTNFALQWSEQWKSVDLNAGYYVEGEAMSKLFSSDEGWKNDSNPTSDSVSISLGTAVDTLTPGASFTKQNGKYIIVYNNFTRDSSVSQGGTIMKSVTFKGFDVFITPLNQPTSVQEGRVGGVPLSIRLEQNYPNPFNPTTKIRFSIVNRQLTIVKVYDVLGREVATLVNEVKEPGTYTIEFNASSLASGVYFYRLSAGQHVECRKMVVMK